MPSKSKDAIHLGAELLGIRDYSSSELLARLQKRGYDFEESQAAVQRLQQLGLIRESGSNLEALKEAAAEWLRKRGEEISPSVLRALGSYLARKGFEEELVMEYLRTAAEVAGLVSNCDSNENG